MKKEEKRELKNRPRETDTDRLINRETDTLKWSERERGREREREREIKKVTVKVQVTKT